MQYRFDNLSSLDFEHLVGDLLSAQTGITFEAFKVGPDGGIDLRGIDNGDTHVVQAKRYLQTTPSGLLSAARKEARAWASRKTPDTYWFVTSLGLSTSNKAKLLKIFSDMSLIEERIIGHEQLQKMLRKYETVARAHMKLWLGETAMLDKFLNSAVFEQSGFEVETALAAARTFVVHGGVGEGLKILEHTGALAITGAPGIGKSTMARMILLAHIEQGWTPIIVDDAADALDAVRSDEPRILYFDDFLGSIALDDDVVRHSDRRINRLIERAAKNPNLRFMMTSRDYILRDAHQRSDRLGRELFRSFEFVLQLPEYTRLERARILYNHLYYGALDKGLVSELVTEGFYDTVIDHPNFNPRLISEMTNVVSADYTPKAYLKAFRSVLDHPETLWKKPYEKHFKLSDRLLVLSMQLLPLHYSKKSWSFSQLRKRFVELNHLLDFNLPTPDIAIEFEGALKRMEGGMIHISDGEVKYANPGVQEFIIGRILNDGHSVRIIKTENGISDLDKWTSAPYYGEKRSADTAQALARRFVELVETISIDAKAISLALRLDKQITSIYGPEMLTSILARYAKGAGHGTYPLELNQILYWREEQLETETPSPLLDEVTKRIERDCDVIANGVRYTILGDILYDTADYALEIGSHSSITPAMKRTGRNMALYSITNFRSSWSPDDANDVNTAVEYLETIGDVYDIDVGHVIRDLETEGPEEDDYSEAEAIKSVTEPESKIANTGVNPADIVKDMFSGLLEKQTLNAHS